MLDLEPIRKRLEAATPLPWEGIKTRSGPVSQFIVHAPADIAALLGEVERLYEITRYAGKHVGNEYWETAPRQEMLNALRFQGGTTQALMKTERQWYERFRKAEARVAELEAELKSTVELQDKMGITTWP